MTPKEKAEQLVEKFLRVEDDTVFYWDPYYDKRYLDEEVLSHAKKCALIAVNLLIDHCQAAEFLGCLENPTEDTYQYWQEVKQELEKL